MDLGVEARAVSHVLYQTANSLKITGIKFLRNQNLRNKMTKQKIVLCELEYMDPKTGKPFTVQRGWPCKDQADAELTVKYYGMKTGAFNAKVKIEDIEHEENK
jgi:hypothetical protein